MLARSNISQSGDMKRSSDKQCSKIAKNKSISSTSKVFTRTTSSKIEKKKSLKKEDRRFLKKRKMLIRLMK